MRAGLAAAVGQLGEGSCIGVVSLPSGGGTCGWAALVGLVCRPSLGGGLRVAREGSAFRAEA